MGYAVLVDVNKCIGCRACVTNCKEWNHLPTERMDFHVGQGDREDSYSPSDNKRHRPELSDKSYCVVEYHKVYENTPQEEWVSVKRQCMHCLEPACNAACPVGALHPTPEGPVIYDSYKCIGCRYCMMACPFSVPSYEWRKAAPFIKKCTFCYDRISDAAQEKRGKALPACVEACPTKTLVFGHRDQLLRDARNRILCNPDIYQSKIYGEHDVGGTSWLYMGHVGFDELGFPQNLGTRSYPSYTELALDAVPVWVMGGGMLMAGVYWLWQRKLGLNGGDEE